MENELWGRLVIDPSRPDAEDTIEIEIQALRRDMLAELKRLRETS